MVLVTVMARLWLSLFPARASVQVLHDCSHLCLTKSVRNWRAALRLQMQESALRLMQHAYGKDGGDNGNSGAFA